MVPRPPCTIYKLLEALDFDLIKVSLKAFDVPTTIAGLYRPRRHECHIRCTWASPRRARRSTGVIRSSAGIGTSAYTWDMGDTLRVSLTTHPREEVLTGYEILKSLDLRQRGPGPGELPHLRTL